MKRQRSNNLKTKSEIRSMILKRLKEMPIKERKLETQRIINKFLNLNEYHSAETIGVTISNSPEFDTHQLITNMLADGKHVFCPRTYSHRQMKFIEVTSNTNFDRSSFGIWEPIENTQSIVNNQPDILIVPGLCYAIENHQRVGFGGGFYDRFIKKYNGYTVSLALSVQMVDHVEWNVEPTDMPIDQIIY